MNDFLVVRDLCKSYRSGAGQLDVLVGLSLTLAKGQMIAITGVSGSGKSTLLHVLGGMDRPERGSILIAGRELLDLSPAELSTFRNETLGFVFQFHHLLPEFSAAENVMMPLLIRGIAAPEARRAAEGALEDVGLGTRIHHRPGELSGGEQQRAAIARALVGRPQLILADEPTGNLDPHTGDSIGVLLHELHVRHNLSSVLVTHNEKLARICSRVYRLENGKLV
jgi:lipoprotein-releasing system ATP-binding protein